VRYGVHAVPLRGWCRPRSRGCAAAAGPHRRGRADRTRSRASRKAARPAPGSTFAVEGQPVKEERRGARGTLVTPCSTRGADKDKELHPPRDTAWAMSEENVERLSPACRQSRWSSSSPRETRPCPTRPPRRLSEPAACTDRTPYFRNDLAFAADPSFPKNPHAFLTRLSFPCLAPCLVALQAQGQIATFFSSDGAVTTDPDGAGALFETPITGPLPEGLNFIP
jgi:hypothetical protein